jgi:hypothetical protein
VDPTAAREVPLGDEAAILICRSIVEEIDPQHARPASRQKHDID